MGTDAAYLVLPKARSRIADYFRLVDHPTTSSRTENGVILIECRTLRNVVTSAAEAETAALFYNGQHIIVLRRLLEALQHPQSPTPLKTDNTTANSFVHNNINQRKSKSWDMRFYWLKDNITKQYIKVYWKRGKDEKDPNKADYHTKHHQIIHHRGIRTEYVLDT